VSWNGNSKAAGWLIGWLGNYWLQLDGDGPWRKKKESNNKKPEGGGRVIRTCMC
jgi:hypothetical protein